MFRTLGLRHLPVVNKEFELQGIITRRNFLEPHHKSGVKQTSFEMTTLKMFMPTVVPEDAELREMGGGEADDTMPHDDSYIMGPTTPISRALAAPTALNGEVGETGV